MTPGPFKYCETLFWLILDPSSPMTYLVIPAADVTFLFYFKK